MIILGAKCGLNYLATRGTAWKLYDKHVTGKEPFAPIRSGKVINDLMYNLPIARAVIFDALSAITPQGSMIDDWGNGKINGTLFWTFEGHERVIQKMTHYRIFQRMIQLILIVVLCSFEAISLAGCLAQSTLLNSTPIAPDILHTLSPAASAVTSDLKTITPAYNPLVWTSTITPTATSLPSLPIPNLSKQVSFQEIDIAASLPVTAQIEGTFVLVEPTEIGPIFESHFSRLIVWDPETGDMHDIFSSGEVAANIFVSPDGKWLVYEKLMPYLTNGGLYSYKAVSIHLVSANKDEYKVIPIEEGWGQLAGWLDDTRLIIRRRADLRVVDATFTAKLILNPFSGERNELPPDPADIYDLFPKPEWRGMGTIAYNSILTHRVYQNNASELVLENLQTHKIMAQIPASTGASIPVWSPDGQKFIMTNTENYDSNGPIDFELYTISLNGQISQQTYLADHYARTNMPYYAWSSDGQKIAFWLEANWLEDSNHAYLAVLNLENSQVTIYSIETSFYYPQMLVWSPDNRQILIGVTNEDGVRTLLIDIVSGWAAQIVQGLTPVGWMIP